MKDTTKKIAGTAGSLLMLSSMGAGAALAFADESAEAPAVGNAHSAQIEARQAGSMQKVQEVLGTFTFSQTVVNTNAEIARATKAAAYLCNSQGSEMLGETAADQWSITVGGDVLEPYTATIAELRTDPSVQRTVLGCACAGNPTDGAAAVNAEVTGVAMKTILGKAEVAEGANTVVFKSSDGYEVALPLRYVTQRYCPIVFDVNGSPIAESVGGMNQLWLGSTSARYFARNIVEITVETRQTPPANPGTAEGEGQYSNLPNVGVFFGGEVE